MSDNFQRLLLSIFLRGRAFPIIIIQIDNASDLRDYRNILYHVLCADHKDYKDSMIDCESPRSLSDLRLFGPNSIILGVWFALIINFNRLQGFSGGRIFANSVSPTGS